MIFNSKDYLTTEETLEFLGMDFLDYSTATRALKLTEIPFEKISDGYSVRLYYLKQDVEELALKVKSFFKEYAIIDEFNIAPHRIRKSSVQSLSMPKGYNPIFFKERLGNIEYKAYKTVYNRKEMESLSRELSILENQLTTNDLNEDTIKDEDYILLKDALCLLNYNDRVFKKIRKENKIREIKVLKNILIHKDDINNLLSKQKEFYAEYIDGKSISEKYLDGKDNYPLLKKLKVYDVPLYAQIKSKATSLGASGGVYKISEIEDLLKDRINYDIECDTPFETFIARLESMSGWAGFSKESSYTSEIWFKYVKRILNTTVSKGGVLSGIISKYIKATTLIKDMLDRYNKSEVYKLTTSEINLYFKSLDLTTQKQILYNFLKFIYQNIIMDKNNDISYKIQFIKLSDSDLLESENVSEYEKGVSSDIIYDFEVYSKVFQYQTDIKMHVEKSLSEIEKSGTCIYASTWLYVMLHLNNAWRHGDVRDFPALDVDDLILQFGISDFSWFRYNNIELSKARGVVSRILQWELLISKTQMEGRFFCSDDLAPALSTAILILTLYNNNLPVKKDTLIDFNTKHNNVSKATLKKFFKDLDVEDFTFSSRKFNKSVMSYITFLANLSGDKKAIEYAKYMRSHIKNLSTLHYIDFNIEAVEGLSSMLFARGEFGYVTSLLLSKLNEGKLTNFEEATEQIYMINKAFGDASTLSATVGFLNTVRGDRLSVLRYLCEMSFEECQELVTDLFARKLPSKCGSDIQCLFSKKGCQRPDLNSEDNSSCFNCPYHIPTIYSLTTLCESIINDLKRYNLESRVPNKFKLQLSIHKKKLVLSEAVQKLGSEYVFNCMGISRDDFIEVLSDIPNPLEIGNY